MLPGDGLEQDPADAAQCAAHLCRTALAARASSHLAEALRALRAAAVLNSGRAAFELGYAYEFGGLALRKDDACAQSWYERSATLGYAPGMARLAIMLRNQGENGRAFEWAAAAARQRTSDDRAGLDYAHGTILLRGLAGERNEARGLQLIRRSADAGFAQSQDVVGDCCVFEEPDIAFCWYMRAALQGLPDCQWLVGTMLGLGDGCKKDEVAATQWFRKAACQGDVDAMQEMFRVLFRTDLPCMSWGEGAYWLVRALLESMSGGVEPVVGDECLIALQERLALEPALCALHSGHRLRELYQYGAEERVAHLVSPAVLSVYCESRKRAQDAVLCFMLARRRPGLPALLLRDVALIITRLMLWPSRSDPEAWNVALVAP